MSFSEEFIEWIDRAIEVAESAKQNDIGLFQPARLEKIIDGMKYTKELAEKEISDKQHEENRKLFNPKNRFA